MKRIFLLPALFLMGNCLADELHNFSEMKSAIVLGKSVRIVIDFSSCTTSAKTLTPIMTVAAFTPNEIGVTDDHIAASLTHLTMNNPAYKDQPVYEHARYTITNNNDVILTHYAMDAATYKLKAEPVTFNCKIDSGVKIYD